MMTTLMRKDFRILKPVLLAMVILALMPMALAMAVWAIDGTPSSDPVWVEVIRVMPGAVVTSLGFAMVTTSAIGAALAARERRERSADHLELLPVPRMVIVLSRLQMGAIACVMPVLAALAVVWLWKTGVELYRTELMVFLRGQEAIEYWRNALAVIAVISTFVLAMFGTSWLAGSILGSDVRAALFGLGAPLFIGLGLLWAMDRLDQSERRVETESPWLVVSVAMVVVGVLTLVFGTLISLRRRTV